MSESIDINKLDASFLHLDRRGHPQVFAVMAELSDNHVISLPELAHRVRVRASEFQQFQIMVEKGRWRPPLLRIAQSWDGSQNVSERHSVDDHQTRAVLGELLAEPLPRDRPLWHITLLNQKAPHRQYLVLRVHHALADGMTATGYGMLFLDGSPAELEPFKRFLDSERFVLDGLGRAEKLRALRSFHISWLAGCTLRRWPRPSNSGRNDVTLISVPTKELYARAKALSVSTRELVLAASGVALYENPLSNYRRPKKIRASLPCTLDSSFRHVGNGTSITVVNLDGRSGEIQRQLATLRPQLQRVDRDKPELALPIMSSPSNMPWLAQRVFTNAGMKVLRLDVEIGINPAAARFRSVLGCPITRVYPVPFLLSTSLCVAGLVSGDYSTFGIVTDGGTLPGYSHKFAHEFASLIVESKDGLTIPPLDSMAAG
jgi:diacylglycerol O-acyltransferase